jgi:hypothetical protein
MAVAKVEQNAKSKESKPTGGSIEQGLVTFAEHLGQWVAIVEAKADGWLDRKTLSEAVGRIRDSAGDLVEQLNRATPSAQTTAKKRARTSAPKLSRGPVDAPGKRHRKPQPKEPIDKRMGEPRGKQKGQKSMKNSPRRSR